MYIEFINYYNERVNKSENYVRFEMILFHGDGIRIYKKLHLEDMTRRESIREFFEDISNMGLVINGSINVISYDVVKNETIRKTVDQIQKTLEDRGIDYTKEVDRLIQENINNEFKKLKNIDEELENE